jgi:hypothetical protein
LYGQVVNICFVFFGVYCLLIGYLIFRSAFLPRILGVLMAFAGLGWMTFMVPPFALHLFPFIAAASALAEIPLQLWLVVMGVNVNDGRNRPAQHESPVYRRSGTAGPTGNRTRFA